MLIEFTVGNYRSFKEPVTLSMVATKARARNKQRDEDNVFAADEDLNLLKSAAIYGANASGKSNLIRAIGFMRAFVVASSIATQAGDLLDVEGFRLSMETIHEPTHFEIVFLNQGTQYRYGFEVNREQVMAEWLYHIPSTREAKLFLREGNSFTLSNAFREGRDVIDKTRDNALFLSVVAQFNGPIAQIVLRWFRELRVVSGLDDTVSRKFTESSLEGDNHREAIVNLVKKLDLGIDGLSLEEDEFVYQLLMDTARSIGERATMAPERVRELKASVRSVVRTHHKVFDAEGQPVSQEVFDIDQHESEGTQKLFALAGPLIDTLKNGRVLVIDEFDARLHPMITCEIIHLFHSREINPHNAQLIFTTHDTNLLSNEIFRRDQIWFTEKDRQGATHLYSLVEYKVRNDASFEKNYIEGRYGAVPFIGDLRRLFGEADG
ncbi:MAG: ATP-binding protein [Chloroflexota bacterium]